MNIYTCVYVYRQARSPSLTMPLVILILPFIEHVIRTGPLSPPMLLSLFEFALINTLSCTKLGGGGSLKRERE